MNKFMVGFVFFAGVGIGWAQSPSAAASPVCTPGVPAKEHGWLKQLEGDWDIEFETVMGPGKPPMKSAGHESAKMLGAFWLVTDLDNKMGEQTMKARMVVGFDARSGKYNGTWVSDMDGHLWVYSGEVTGDGKVLDLHAQGPNMMEPGKMAEYTDSLEVVDADHRVLRSQMKMPDGTWMKFMTAKYTRVKK